MFDESKQLCDAVVGLLPWLLNDTLEVAERRSVLEHLRGCTRCCGALEATRDVARAAATHLPIEWILDLAEGATLDGVDAAVAEAHLATCATCRSELLALGAEEPVSAQAEDVASGVTPLRRPASRPTPWRALALAATLAAAIAGLGWWRSAVTGDGLPGPVAGVVAVELLPRTTSRGEEHPASRVTVRPGDRFVVITLLPDLVVDHGKTLYVIGADGEERVFARGLRPDASGEMSVLVPAAALAPGRYVLVLTLDDSPPGEFDEVYSLDISLAP